MNGVTLIFGDTATMSSFILRQKISALEVDSRALTVHGVISEYAILMARTLYNAELVAPVPYCSDEF